MTSTGPENPDVDALTGSTTDGAPPSHGIWHGSNPYLTGNSDPFGLERWGILSAGGPPSLYSDTGIWSAGNLLVELVWLPANKPFTKMVCASKGTTATVNNTGAPCQMGYWDINGNLLGNTADDQNMFATSGWHVRDLVTPNPGLQQAQWVYAGLLINGWNSVNSLCAVGSNAANSFPDSIQVPVTGTRRIAFTKTGVNALPATFDPNTYGTPTVYRTFVGFVE